jgi:hypothetical protein
MSDAVSRVRSAVLAVAALVVVAAVVSQVTRRDGWLLLLQKRSTQENGWGRLPEHQTPQAHELNENGWGRLPQRHKPRVRQKLPAVRKHHTVLEHELPSVYHLPARAPSQEPEANRLAAETLAHSLRNYHAQASNIKRRISMSRLKEGDARLPPGYHILRPGQKLPKGARIVKTLPLPEGYHVLKPGMTLPEGAQLVLHPPRLAARYGSMNVPLVSTRNHMLDEDEVGEGEEGGEEAPRVAEPTVVEPTADERMAIAIASNQGSRVERRKARELKDQVPLRLLIFSPLLVEAVCPLRLFGCSCNR